MTAAKRATTEIAIIFIFNSFRCGFNRLERNMFPASACTKVLINVPPIAVGLRTRTLPRNHSASAATKGSANSTPLAFQRHQQHSINLLSADSPPAAKSGASSFSDSRGDPMRRCTSMAGGDIITVGAVPIRFSRLRRRAPRLALPRAIYGLIRASQNECAEQRNKDRRRD